MTTVSNADLRREIYQSKLSYTDLPRRDRLALPSPDLYVDDFASIPNGFIGLVQVADGSYLPSDMKLPFPAFQLWRDGAVIARCFWKMGEQSIHGRLTDGLGVLILLLVENYSRKSNWAGYSYLDELKGAAIESALGAVLRYDERKTSNPFAFLTTNTFYAFARAKKRESTLSEYRKKEMDLAYRECAYSLWAAEQNESDNDFTAIYDELCAQMDLLMQDELRRKSKCPISVRKYPHHQTMPAQRVKMTPVLSAAIKYGLGIGLEGGAIAAYFRIEPATISRIKNDVVRSNAKT